MSGLDTATHRTEGDVKCHGCGAVLHYTPGTSVLTCAFCSATRNVAEHSEQDMQSAVQEHDLVSALQEHAQKALSSEVVVVTCKACGALVHFKPNVVSDACVFCATPLHAERTSAIPLYTPSAVLPFKLDEKKALERFSVWLNGLWFAPSSLKKAVSERFHGVYIPYWTYDAHADTDYAGKRGDNYYEQERYTSFENGKEVTRTRTVTRIRWSHVSGHVHNTFDDVLVPASKSLPLPKLQVLEPWDLSQLVPYHPDYMAGFRTEAYQIDVHEGLGFARKRMEEQVERSVRQDIGGDHQEIIRKDTQWSHVTFKHIVLPLWISAYRFKGRTYRFLVNSRTGEVTGERPWSVWKIAAAVVCACAVGAMVVSWFSQLQ